MSRLCEGRVVIVTGGGRGIGREYCLMLAREGARVIVNDLGVGTGGEGSDRTPAQEVVDAIAAEGGEAIVNTGDVSNWVEAAAMIEGAVERFGRLDVLINNAGILRDRMLVNMSEADWDAVIRVHLKGSFAPLHHAAVYWREQAKSAGAPVNARVINTSSVSGIYGNIGQANYGAAKQGIAALTIIAARELGRYGVTVNAIAPGARTRLTDALLAPSEGEVDRRAPHWIAPIAVWLASEQSSAVTGRMFEANGDILAVAEGWRRGPTAEAVSDPHLIGPVVAELLSKARKNSGMDGRELD